MRPTADRPVLAIAALTLFLVPWQPATAQPTDDLASWQERLREIGPDHSRGSTVQDLVLERDVGTLVLSSGAIHLLEELGDRTLGAVWVGEGTFRFTPSIQVERDQLLRAFGVDTIVRPIRSAVLLFTDVTLDELSRTVDWAPRTPPEDADREVEEALKYVTDEDGWIARDAGVPLANGGPGFFYAHVAEDRDEPLILSVNPYAFEETSLFRKADGRGERREVVVRHHRKADYETGSSVPQEALDLVRVSGYEIETTIRDNLDIQGAAVATLRVLAADHRWIPFRLHPELEVDSIYLEGGPSLAFHRPEEDRADLWVDLGERPADSLRVVFRYGGDLMDRPRGLWVQVKSQTTWFPVYEYGRAIPYQLTFHAPEDLEVASVGTRMSLVHDEEAEVVTTVWKTPPIRHVTFNIGDFDRHRVAGKGVEELTVQVNERAHRTLWSLAAEQNVYLLEQRDMAEVVAADLGNSFAFFDEVFGPPPVQRFIATEIPFRHGSAYPGLVLLSWGTFQWTSSEGFDEMFRSHEVAHQWWGIAVRPATYRDRWLAEGFAEFSGLWYAARVNGSVDMYRKRLKETREALLERRDETPPVSLGTRAGSIEHPGDYQLVVYRKGAWVPHMLRTLLTDTETGNDDLFAQLMKTFYSTYRGQAVTTAHFQSVAEEVVGADLDWFFRQWVHGSAIPTYRFSHKLEEQPDGTVKATIRIRQENVPDDFRMIVPLLVDFGDEGSALLRVNVVGEVTEAELPLLPREPDRIELNPFESVLAETRTEGWKDEPS